MKKISIIFVILLFIFADIVLLLLILPTNQAVQSQQQPSFAMQLQQSQQYIIPANTASSPKATGQNTQLIKKGDELYVDEKYADSFYGNELYAPEKYSKEKYLAGTYYVSANN